MPDTPAPTLADLLADEIDVESLTDEALQARRDALAAAITAANEGERNVDVLELMKAAGAQVAAADEFLRIRAEEADRIQAEADAIVAAVTAAVADPEADADTETDDETDAVATDGDEVVAADETPEVPAADAKPSVRDRARRAAKVPARAQPKPEEAAPAVPRIIATGETIGVAAGTEFVDIDEMNHAVFDKWLSLAKSGDGYPHNMARIDYRHLFGPEQTLMSGDPSEITDKVLAFTRARAESRFDGGAALGKLRVASGGVPGPAEPRYAQITFGQADRPLRDALPNFLAARGQIIYNGSPTLADVATDDSNGSTVAAIGKVTSAADASGTTKNVQEISAPSATTVTVEAETLRWQQGNFADRFYPERTAAFMRLGMVAFARHNDALRLADIKTNCTKYTDPAAYGAYTDLKRQFLGQTEFLEDLVRDFDLPIRVLMPEYVPSLLATDLIARAPGDEAWRITEEAVRADMQGWDPRVTITWLKDSIRGRLSTSPSGQSPRTAGFDADVEWAMFPEGAFLFLDGGQLDLGILRDTVVSATNKFQTFYESWEAVAPLLSSTLCSWITSQLCASGVTQLPIAVSKCSPQSS